MDKTDLLVGLDIGTTSVKAVVADTASNEMQIIGAANGPTKGMRHGKIVDIDDSTDNVLFIVENDNSDDIYIPVADEFVYDIDHFRFLNKLDKIIVVNIKSRNIDRLLKNIYNLNEISIYFS